MVLLAYWHGLRPGEKFTRAGIDFEYRAQWEFRGGWRDILSRGVQARLRGHCEQTARLKVVISGPNKFGKAMVWLRKDAHFASGEIHNITRIQCFMPGSGV
jgi:hypothetical protein